VPKLLLADDSPTTQKVVQLTFADEGIEVVIADDGDSAMELYAHHRPDIVLADINIPGLNGYEVCEAIRKRADNGATPVILLAGSFEPFDVELAHRVGANDYLTKPFASIRRLVATVTALLDGAVKHDTAAEETVEPNSVLPDASDSDAEPVAELESESQPAPAAELEPDSEPARTVAQSPENAPGPSLPPEPDMYATDDIENLISQSFVETVEMPHTVVERVLSEISSQKADQPSEQPASRTDDVAFDDELIETTFANEPDGSIGHSETIQEEVPVDERFWESVSPFHSESDDLKSSQNGVSAAEAEHREEPLVEEFVPPQADFAESQTGQSEPAAETNTAELRLAPTEEFQIDQSGDEAYFEPAAEPVDEKDELQSTFQEASPPVDENVGVDEPINYQEPPLNEVEYQADQQIKEPEMVDEPSAGFTEPESEPTEEHTPTPWESVAEPQPARFSLDESNLLELPVGFGSRSGQIKIEPDNEYSPVASAIAPDIINEIARATASQISEELVREIAQRIVPKVIEEVMARRKSENIDE
jgi:CheY-like chemotaxis protein